MKLSLWLFTLALYAQGPNLLQVERVASNFHYVQGPVWSREGFLIFSDIPTSTQHQIVPGEGVVPYRDKTEGANGNALDERGRLYVTEAHARRVVRVDKKGKVEVLADRWEGKRLNAPNGIVVRHDGHVYFTDPAFGKENDTRELDFFGVYHITPKGEIEVIAKPAGRPKGVALSPNGKILYVSNADERNIRAYDLDRAGAAANERILISGIEGIPGGMAVDEKGVLYIAARKLLIYSADGTAKGVIELAETPSNCAFGDADFQGLYITAQTSVYRVRLSVKGAVQY